MVFLFDEGSVVGVVFIQNCYVVVLVQVCCEYLGFGSLICVMVVNIGNVNVGIGEFGFVYVCQICFVFVLVLGLQYEQVLLFLMGVIMELLLFECLLFGLFVVFESVV